MVRGFPPNNGRPVDGAFALTTRHLFREDNPSERVTAILFPSGGISNGGIHG